MSRKHLAAAAAWMLVIWVVSSRPGDGGLPLLPWHLDKLAHALEFGLLGFLLARGLGSSRRAAAAAVALAALYGGLDELHQLYVPGRDASPFDWGADILGGAAGMAAALCREQAAGNET